MTTLADLLAMYGGSGPQAGLISNDVFQNNPDDPGSTRGADLLKLAQQYDPNAHIGTGSDGRMEGSLVFDRSKLPTSVMGNLSKFDLGGGKGGNIWDNYALVDASGKANGGAHIKDPTKIIHDPNYGDFVAKNNLDVAPGDSTSGFMGQLGKYAPYAVSAVMSAGLGAGAGPLLGAALMSAGGPGGIIPSMVDGQKPDWKKIGINAATSAAGGLLGGATNGLTQGLDPWAQSLAKQGLNAGLGAAGSMLNGGKIDGGSFAKNFAENYAASLVPGGNQALAAYNMFKQING